MRSERTEAYWAAFCEATGVRGRHDVVAFGDSPRMRDELAALVVNGQKRATAGLLRDFGSEDLPVPRAGDHVVVVDGSGDPVLVYQSTEVRIGPLSSVDAQFAWDEGEGDRSLADWIEGHHAYFARQAQAEGFVFHDDIETVFERFRVIWPPEIADGRSAPA